MSEYPFDERFFLIFNSGKNVIWTAVCV